MTNNGWRKPTPGLLQAEKFAKVGEQLSIPKTQAIVAMKKVAAAIGLKAPDMLLLDTLAALTQPQDWEQGRRPIVWPSNAFLEEQTGFSLAALKRHIRRLCEAGVVSMKDSPNGKRWGRRDDDGVIVQAYGFDLAPLAARAVEFEALHAHLRQERQFCQAQRNIITVTRRIIRAKIDKAMETRLRGPWRDLQEEFTLMLQSLPKRSTGAEKLLDLVDWFQAMRSKVEEAFADAFDWPEESDVKSGPESSISTREVVSLSIKTNPTGINNEPHILTTKQPNHVHSNINERINAEKMEQELLLSVEADRPQDVDLDINWSSHTNERRSEVDIGTLMLSCPHFAEMARTLHGYLNNWNDVHRVAGQIRPMAGISEDAWNVAQKVMGPAIAAAALALIFDKHTTGEVKSPGGYLRGMVEKAQKGELHLDRSFYGRLSENHA